MNVSIDHKAELLYKSLVAIPIVKLFYIYFQAHNNLTLEGALCRKPV